MTTECFHVAGKVPVTNEVLIIQLWKGTIITKKVPFINSSEIKLFDDKNNCMTVCRLRTKLVKKNFVYMAKVYIYLFYIFFSMISQKL